MHRVDLNIRGHVQGVGFRWFVWRRALGHGLSGWVRNRPDGSVEVQAEGPQERLVTFVARVRRGPEGARVDSVDETWAEGPAGHHDFAIRD